MNSRGVDRLLYLGEFAILDPGTTKTIVVDRTLAYCNLVSATTETRTLGRPTRQGVFFSLHHYTDGGDITVTVTGGFNETGDTTFVFSDAGQFAFFQSFYDGTNYYWRLISHYGLGNASPTESAALDGLTATVTELNTMHSQTLATGAGTGITGGTGTIYKNSVWLNGGIYTTRLLIDLTGLASSTTDLDVIGVSTPAAYIAKLTAAECGTTILAVSMVCLEAPAGGVADIDLYSATEGTGVFDSAVTDLTETALITAGGSWTNGTTKAATTAPLSTEYLYLTGGAAGTAATYTAGKFLITILGY